MKGASSAQSPRPPAGEGEADERGAAVAEKDHGAARPEVVRQKAQARADERGREVHEIALLRLGNGDAGGSGAARAAAPAWLSSPPPRMGVGRSGRSSTLAHRQDPQPVTRGGIEVAKHVEPGRSRSPEQRDQAPSIEGKLSAVEDDEAGAGFPGRGKQIVGPDARQRDPAPLAVEGDEWLPVEEHRVARLGRGDPARRLPVHEGADVRPEDGLERPRRQDQCDQEDQRRG
jgi:hypothetical protein